MPGFLSTSRKKRLFTSPNSLTTRQRADARYHVKKEYEEFIADLKMILESANEKDRKFFLDMLFEIPQVAARLSGEPEPEETGDEEVSDEKGAYYKNIRDLL